MEKMIQCFLLAIKEQAHILKLFEKIEMLKIKLVCNDVESLLVFHHGEVFLLVDNDEKSVSNVISGELDAFARLLEGKEQLRKLIKTGDLRVETSFRVLLLIESIFFLTKPNELVNKIIS